MRRTASMSRRAPVLCRRTSGMRRRRTKMDTTWGMELTAMRMVTMISRRSRLPATSALRPGLCASRALHPAVRASSHVNRVCVSRFISLPRTVADACTGSLWLHLLTTASVLGSPSSLRLRVCGTGWPGRAADVVGACGVIAESLAAGLLLRNCGQARPCLCVCCDRRL
ncbi:hydrophilic acylated surface protein a [Leishmania infantum JPCM5]|uniref:Hydrophilic acylated surface protein a n=1 Tax=Leishmania infantum TaxID=5671 RepID=A4I0F6_LEIIN|nr:hydrophilic acylated surface protein a [Leishmania infantum JPCM5]CAM68226.1 hydrophilic acylated surface protein a [Leishmania infantum JPCM5]|eukprot:XP_001465797.1 hydrophilic acylated surface protein a [Leishmania infantum JPCM5]